MNAAFFTQLLLVKVEGWSPGSGVAAALPLYLIGPVTSVHVFFQIFQEIQFLLSSAPFSCFLRVKQCRDPSTTSELNIFYLAIGILSEIETPAVLSLFLVWGNMEPQTWLLRIVWSAGNSDRDLLMSLLRHPEELPFVFAELCLT